MTLDLQRSWRAIGLVVPVLALGGIAAGCGEEDSAASGGGGGTAQPAALAIEATSAQPPEFKVPATAPAGAVTITFTNSTKDDIDGQLARAEGDHSDEEVLAQLNNAKQGKPVAGWFEGAGGVGSTEPGKTDSVTQVLEPGTYYVVGGDDSPDGALEKFEVKAGEGADLPRTDAKITATEYGFTAEGLKAGANRVELRNDGREWHHFLASEMKPDATIEDVRKFLLTEKGEVPFASEEGADSAVMNGGVSQVVNLDLKPGKYAFFCYIADRKGGPPHVVKGMVSEVTVEK
jgi:hypothetical protein